MVLQKSLIAFIELIRDITSRFILIKPDRLFIVVTRRCNARCNMCRIWADKDIRDLPTIEWEKIFHNNNNFFSDIIKLDITGGEPFLYEDLIPFISMCIRLLPNIKKIIITTNGLLTDKIINNIKELLKLIHNKNIFASVTVSIDGIGKLHDTIRGVNGIYDKAKETLIKLNVLAEKESRLKTSVATVVGKENISQLEEIAHEIRTVLKISDHLFIPAVYSDNFQKNSECDLTFNDKENKKFREFLIKAILNKKTSPYHKLVYKDIIRMMNGFPSKRNCPLLKRSIIIDYEGTILPCFSSDKTIFGSAFNDINKIWTGENRKKIIKEYKYKRCPKCMFVCGVGYLSLLTSFFTWRLDKYA